MNVRILAPQSVNYNENSSKVICFLHPDAMCWWGGGGGVATAEENLFINDSFQLMRGS